MLRRSEPRGKAANKGRLAVPRQPLIQLLTAAVDGIEAVTQEQ